VSAGIRSIRGTSRRIDRCERAERAASEDAQGSRDRRVVMQRRVSFFLLALAIG
jgi:hypothetical protein